jgi:hypothetical protein
VNNTQSDGSQCGKCFDYVKVGDHYGRCATVTMVDMSALGKEMEETRRPAIRFDCDWCESYGR